MLGLKTLTSAATTIRGIELMHRIRKGQFNLRGLATHGKPTSEIWAAVLAEYANRHTDKATRPHPQFAPEPLQ